MNRQGKMSGLYFLILVSATWVLIYLQQFPVLFRRWNNEDYSYCFLVPLLAAYLLWDNRARIFKAAGGGRRLGYALLCLSVLFFLAGRLSALEVFVYFSMWLSIAGLILVYFGTGVIRAVSFGLFILLFMVPAPPFITNQLTFKLKLISSALAEKMLYLLSVPAYREGNIIDLGVSQLQVVEACSGLRYFIPTIILSLLMGYFFHRRLWSRVLLVVLAAPVAILSNAFRVAGTGVLIKHVSVKAAQGFFHDFSGWLVYVISIALLAGFSFVIKKVEGGSREKKGIEVEKPVQSGSLARLYLHGTICAAVLVLGFAAQVVWVKAQIIPQRTSFASFSMDLAGWKGERLYLDQAILDQLWADDYVSGTYVNPETGNMLHLLVSYYEHQSTRHTAHAPTSCLVGGGWAVKEKEVVPPNGKRNFPVNRMILDKGGQTIISNFWFEQRGRVITSEYMNKLYLFWDAVVMRRTDGALVRVEIYMQPGQTLEQGQDLLDEFVAELKSALRDYVPGAELNGR